jgi:hypothetical protein
MFGKWPGALYTCSNRLPINIEDQIEEEREGEGVLEPTKKGKKAIFHTTNYNVCQSEIECLNTQHTYKQYVAVETEVCKGKSNNIF